MAPASQAPTWLSARKVRPRRPPGASIPARPRRRRPRSPRGARVASEPGKPAPERRGVRAGGTVTPLVRPLHAGGPDQRHELRSGLAQALAAARVEVVGEGHELAEQAGVEVVARLL